MKSKELKETYSGDRSIDFWKAINSIENNDLQEIAYGLGCDLQNYEADLLGKINALINARG